MTAYLTTQQAAAILGVSVFTVRRWIDEGKLKAYRPGGQYRITEDQIRACLTRRK